MISQRAKLSIEHLLIRSIKRNFVRSNEDSCNIVQSHENNFSELFGKTIYTQTISTFFFRALFIFHLNDNPPTTSYFGTDSDDRNIEQIFPEFVNLCCGEINRDLGNYFPHTGQSTPYILNKKCVSFLEEIKPSFVSSHTISINKSIQIGVTLCISAYEAIDFEIGSTLAEEQNEEQTGELELF